jgi:hypothetical protein
MFYLSDSLDRENLLPWRRTQLSVQPRDKSDRIVNAGYWKMNHFQLPYPRSYIHQYQDENEKLYSQESTDWYDNNWFLFIPFHRFLYGRI